MNRLKRLWDHGKMIGNMKAGLLVSLAACFMLFIFAPLEIYLSNPGEFWYDAYQLAPFCLKIFVCAFAASMIGFLLAYLCGDVIYDIALAGYFIAFLGCYIQGNFLVDGLPPFDGTEVNWALYRTEQIKSDTVWIVTAILILILLGVLHSRKFRALTAGVSIFLFLVLGSTLCVLGIQGNILEQKEFVKFTTDGQFVMSKDTNFIILVLDAVDEECFWEVWEQHPEYEEAMSDFTFYNNAMCGYPYTEYSLPLILSGEWYENQEPFEDYRQRVYRNAPIFNTLRSQGYHLNFYDDELQFELGELDGAFENMSHAKWTLHDPFLFAKRQIKMVGIKYAPYVLKPYCWFDPAKLWHQQLAASGGKLFAWQNGAFYEDVQSDAVEYSEDNQFKLIHLMGAHVPFLYDRYVNETEDADYFSCIESSMTVTMAYLQKLRDAGVYDNSIILVMSDHGYNISGDAAKIPQRNENSTCRQHPILFVKGLGESHELQISGAPVSFEDMSEAYDKLLDGAASDEIFEYREGDSRERRYLFHWFMGEDCLEEYIQTGYAGDESTLVPTGRVFQK